MWWPLWTSVAILVLIDTRTRAQRSQRTRTYDAHKSSCFGCLPAPGGTCDDATLLICKGATPSCATTAITPSLTSQFICTPDAPPTQPCSLTFTEETQTYNITCSCHHNYCASHFTEHLVRNLTKFVAVNKVKDGQLIQEYLKFANLSHLPSKEVITTLTNKTQILKYSSELHETTLSPEKVKLVDSNRTVSPEVLINELRRDDVIERLPKADALKQEVTVPSDDDEDDGEGSGASEEGRGQRRPAAAAPAAPSSFLPANTNAANKIFLTFTLFPFLIYIFT